MVGDLVPLYKYMRRYRWGYVWGTLSCICTNAVWVQFPRVLERAVCRAPGEPQLAQNRSE